jgi:hypothetical protein
VTVSVSRGARTLILRAPNHDEATLRVEAVVGQTVPARATLQAHAGRLRVRASVEGAVVRARQGAGESRLLADALGEGATLPVGVWTIEVSCEGFEPLERTVDITRDALESVDVVLVPRVETPGTLLVSWGERDAVVRIDGVNVARTPAALPIPPGDHRIEVEGSGGRILRRTVRVASGRSEWIDFSEGER